MLPPKAKSNREDPTHRPIIPLSHFCCPRPFSCASTLIVCLSISATMSPVHTPLPNMLPPPITLAHWRASKQNWLPTQSQGRLSTTRYVNAKLPPTHSELTLVLTHKSVPRPMADVIIRPIHTTRMLSACWAMGKKEKPIIAIIAAADGVIDC
jgi:hypothetical protein